MSSGISKDKKITNYEEALDKREIIEQIDLSKVHIPFSAFFEEIAPEKESIEIKGIQFIQCDPEFQKIMREEFLE